VVKTGTTWAASSGGEEAREVIGDAEDMISSTPEHR